MPDGMVIDDDEKIGSWATFDQTGILIDFETTKQRDNFLELAREHGATLSFLEENPDIDQE